MERAGPVHRLGRCRPVRAWRRRSGSCRRAAARVRVATGCRAHITARPRHPNDGARTRGCRAPVDPGAAVVAAQRTALRCPPGEEQGGDAARVRGRAVHALAPLVRRPAAAARIRVRAGRRPRSSLRRVAARRAAHDRMPEGRARARPSVLVRRDRSRPTCGPARAGLRSRQLAARARQASRRNRRSRHRRAEHPHRRTASLRVRRVAAAVARHRRTLSESAAPTSTTRRPNASIAAVRNQGRSVVLPA